MPLTIDHIVEIDAPADAVWRVLTDFEHYTRWNPLAVRCSSTLVPGEPIDMLVRLGPSRFRRQREWVRTHTPGREFSYTMKPVPLGALRSLRSQELADLEANRTRYTAHFEVRGWLAPLVRFLFGRTLRRGFDGVANGLRVEAERA